MLLGARSCTGRGGACTGALGGREAAPGASHPRTGQLVPPGGSRGSDPGCPSLTPCANAGFSRAGPKTVKSPARSRSPRAEADGARPATARSWTHKHPAPALQVGARLRFPLTARRVRVAWGRRAGDSKLIAISFFFRFQNVTSHELSMAIVIAGRSGPGPQGHGEGGHACPGPAGSVGGHVDLRRARAARGVSGRQVAAALVVLLQLRDADSAARPARQGCAAGTSAGAPLTAPAQAAAGRMAHWRPPTAPVRERERVSE